MLADETLKRYFLEEINYLRRESVKFAGEYPEVAHELTLNEESAADPQVEMMLQSFAYLTGKLRYQMDLDDALLPNQMLASLCPHLESPWPAASVVEFDVKKGNFSKPQIIQKNTPLRTDVDLHGEKYPCRFMTRYDTPIWPVSVKDISCPAVNQTGVAAQNMNLHGVVRLRLEAKANFDFSSLSMESLAFYLNGPDRFRLNELFQRHFLGAVIIDPRRTEEKRPEQKLGPNSIQFKGLGIDDALIPGDVKVNPGLPLLREYFLFPEKFLFAELGSFNTDGFGKQLDILFFFDREVNDLAEGSIKLNCAPVINLYSQAIEPISIRSTRLEYQVTGDQFYHAQCEIHSLQELNFLYPTGKVSPIEPMYGERQSPFGYWVSRREPSQLPSVPGTETFLRFLNDRFESGIEQGVNVMGRAWCTNRGLPEKLPMHCTLQLDVPGVVTSARLIKRPTRHQTPALTGDQTRRLVAQLNSHYLPLLTGEDGLQSIRQLLLEHTHSDHPESKKQISSLLSLQCRQVGRRVGSEAWKGYCHGTEVSIEINEHKFDGASVILFGQVLNECLANFVPLNSFIQLKFIDRQGGVIRLWPARVGDQCLL